ncbi:UNVERIFIED_CONTAM: hypothetical protein LK11_60005 [Mumia flava]
MAIWNFRRSPAAPAITGGFQWMRHIPRTVEAFGRQAVGRHGRCFGAAPYIGRDSAMKRLDRSA